MTRSPVRNSTQAPLRLAILSAVPADIGLLQLALGSIPHYVLCWQADNVDAACRLCVLDRPDVLLMDLFAPPCGAAEATRRIMVVAPCAILLLAADVGRYASDVFEAMGRGALDAVDIPAPPGRSGRVHAVALLRKLEQIRARLAEVPTSGTADRRVEQTGVAAGMLVAIGASAGGPAALRTVLSTLPHELHAAVVIVQHLDERFAPGMVEWLGQCCALPVRLAREGDVPEAGTVLVAGTNDHLLFKGPARLGYSPEPLASRYRPSVDIFFQSLVKWWQGRAIGVMLTGMGRDGALGLKSMRDKGHHTIAQDQLSSAVYGMPKAAIDLGAAADVLGAGQIAANLVELVNHDRQ